MRSRYWLYLGLLIVSSIIVYVYTDRTEQPNPDAFINNSIPLCNEDFKFDGQVCRKENPLGHSPVPLFQFLAWGIAIADFAAYELEGHRTYRSNKILPYNNKYGELRPIPRAPDYFCEKNIFWAYKGFNAILKNTEEEIYVAKEKFVTKIGGNFILKGSLQRVTARYLFEYVGYDSKLQKKIIGDMKDPIIYVILPILDYGILKSFHSLKGSYGFEADRFNDVMNLLFKREKGIEFQDKNMSESNKAVLTKGKDIVQIMANIGDGTRRARGQDLVQPERVKKPREIYNESGREEM